MVTFTESSLYENDAAIKAELCPDGYQWINVEMVSVKVEQV